MINEHAILKLINQDIVFSNSDCPGRYAPENLANEILEYIMAERIEVIVTGGVAYCDDLRVVIIDNDVKEDEEI